MLLEENKIYNEDCMITMDKMSNNSIDLLLTDIPYEKVNKNSNGLRKLDKEKANSKTFDLDRFLKEVFRVTKGSGYIFCGKEQVSEIFSFFDSKGLTTRLMIWEKTNPSPMNAKHVWISGIECFVYFKKPKATFNAFYKNTVIRNKDIENNLNNEIVRFPNGSSKLHPTEKPIRLFEYLISISSNRGDLVYDPCLGSGTTALAARSLDRKYIASEIDKSFYKISLDRLKNFSNFSNKLQPKKDNFVKSKQRDIIELIK